MEVIAPQPPGIDATVYSVQYNRFSTSQASERHIGLRRRGHSYQLVCYNFSSTGRCFVIRMLYDSL